ncbi:MAG: hypothetical protein ACTSPY_12325 [Candidatus Helarchaeota archaeon]
MIFKLKEKCLETSNKEFFYGNIINKEIKDVYLGLGYLDNGEHRSFSPGKGHEEIIYLLNGQMKIIMKETEYILNEGEAIYIPESIEITISNLVENRIFFVIAGGHTEKHAHSF